MNQEDPSEEETAPVAEQSPPTVRRYPSTIGGFFYLAILVTAITGVGIAANGEWRLGVRLLAGSLAAAAILRLLLPRRDAGMLAVRHRLLDVTVLVLLSVSIFLLAAGIPDQPV